MFCDSILLMPKRLLLHKLNFSFLFLLIFYQDNSCRLSSFFRIISTPTRDSFSDTNSAHTIKTCICFGCICRFSYKKLTKKDLIRIQYVTSLIISSKARFRMKSIVDFTIYRLEYTNYSLITVIIIAQFTNYVNYFEYFLLF